MRNLNILFYSMLVLFFNQAHAQQIFTEGTHYTVLSEKMPVETGDKIEVREVFWYGCPHCFKLEPGLNEWLKNIPESAAFTRMPAIFSPVWEQHAKFYYALEALGELDNLHLKVFDEIHVNNKKLKNDEEFVEFAVRQGLDKNTVEETLESFTVNSKLAAAKMNMSNYAITGVPAVVINGEYLSDITSAGSEPKFFQIIEFLINKAAAEKQKTPVL